MNSCSPLVINFRVVWLGVKAGTYRPQLGEIAKIGCVTQPLNSCRTTCSGLVANDARHQDEVSPAVLGHLVIEGYEDFAQPVEAIT